MSKFIVTEKPGMYQVNEVVTQDDILSQAADILFERIKKTDVLSSPDDTRQFLKYQIAGLEHELFVVLFLDNRHRVISYKELFRGTVDGASVYPREVIKEALSVNASAMIIAHNHPSGIADPSDADIRITKRLKETAQLVDIRLLDHFVIGCNDIVSLAERGDL